jgi:hypothetical protein
MGDPARPRPCPFPPVRGKLALFRTIGLLLAPTRAAKTIVDDWHCTVGPPHSVRTSNITLQTSRFPYLPSLIPDRHLLICVPLFTGVLHECVEKSGLCHPPEPS